MRLHNRTLTLGARPRHSQIFQKIAAAHCTTPETVYPLCMHNAKTNTVYRTFTADYSSEQHYAIDAAGRVFTRMRCKGWGGRYQNRPWRFVALTAIPEAAVDTGRKCRLPESAPLCMHNAKTNTVYRTFTADYSSEQHYAIDAAGRVFTRMRCKGWGGRYQNRPWRFVALTAIPEAAVDTGRKCRLPESASGY